MLKKYVVIVKREVSKVMSLHVNANTADEAHDVALDKLKDSTVKFNNEKDVSIYDAVLDTLFVGNIDE